MFLRSMALIAVWRLIWINLRAAGVTLDDVRCLLAAIRFVGYRRGERLAPTRIQRT
jgi:hypothetical protein